MNNDLQNYLQATAQALVSDLGVSVRVITHERTQFSQFHDHTPPFIDTDFIIDDRITLNVHYKFISSWRSIGTAWYRMISFDTHTRLSGNGTFLSATLKAWLAAQRIYDHLMTMHHISRIKPVASDAPKIEVIGQ